MEEHVHCPDSTQCETPKASKLRQSKEVNRWARRNIYGVSTSMLIVYTAFVGLQNLQSSINSNGGLGLVSLSVLYGAFVVVGVFTPTILKLCGTKYSLLVGYLCILLYTLCNYYPSWYTLIPGSVILGLASGPIWAASGSHLVHVAREVKANTNKHESYLIGKYMGIFYFFFQFCQVPGNLASSLILFPYSTVTEEADDIISEERTTLIKAPLYSSVSRTEGNSTDVCNLLENTTIQATYLYILVSVYTLFIMVGIIVLLSTVDKLDTAEHKVQTKFKTYLKQPILELFSVFKSIRMILLAPSALYSGMEMALVYGTFTRMYISECIGTYQVGFSLVAMGVSNSLMSFVCSKLVKCIPRHTILLIGAAAHVTIFIFLSLWERQPSYYAVYGIAVLWGTGNAVWNMLTTCQAGIYFPKKLDSAFSVLRMWVGLGFMLSFVTTDLVSLQIRIWFLLGLLVLVVTSNLILECVFTPKEERSLCCKRVRHKSSTPGHTRRNVRSEMEQSNEEQSADFFPIYNSSTIFDTCGSNLLGEMTTSFLYRCNGDVASMAQSTTSSCEDTSEISNNPLIDGNNFTASISDSYVRSSRFSNTGSIHESRSEDVGLSRSTSSHSRSIGAHSSVPLFSQYTSRTLSDLSTSFVYNVIQENSMSSNCAVKGSCSTDSSSSNSNSVFEIYDGQGLMKLTSSFVRTCEGNKTGCSSNNSVFQEYEGQGLSNLTTSFLDTRCERARHSTSYTCDSIDGNLPFTQSDNSFSLCLPALLPSTHTQAEHNCLNSPLSTSYQAVDGTSARLSFETIERNKNESQTIKNQDEHNKTMELEQSTTVNHVHLSVSRNANPTIPYSSSKNACCSGESRDSRSDVIFIGPRCTGVTDEEDERKWVSVSLSRYSI